MFLTREHLKKAEMCLRSSSIRREMISELMSSLQQSLEDFEAEKGPVKLHHAYTPAPENAMFPAVFTLLSGHVSTPLSSDGGAWRWRLTRSGISIDVYLTQLSRTETTQHWQLDASIVNGDYWRGAFFGQLL